jgi:hypothetical protein
LSHASSPFYSGYFGDRVSLFLPRLAWTTIFLFYASIHHWDDRCAITPSFFLLRCDLTNFLTQTILELWSSGSQLPK